MGLKISLSNTKPLQAAAEVLIVGVPQGGRRKGLAGAIAKKLGVVATKAISRSEFNGKSGQICEFGTGGKIRPLSVVLVGLGKEFGSAEIRRATAVGVRRGQGSKSTSAAVAMPEVDGGLQAIAEGSVFGRYRYLEFKTKAKKGLDKVIVLTSDRPSKEQRAEASHGQNIAESVCIARDLINCPPNELYPEKLGEIAKELAAEHKKAGLSCTVMSHKQIKEKGMNLLEAVGRGSARGPRLIHLKYRPPGAGKEDLPKLVFVGKGITFDTGGICLKPGPGMGEMKGDMGGAANVVALMAAVAHAQPQAEIHGIIPSAENMPGHEAYRPGDVFTGYNGTTVEIINTDAEGRLVLADALAYATELEPDFIIDNATLTGACVVALGQTVTAYFSDHEELADLMKTSAAQSGEAMWRLPLVKELNDKLKSDTADCKHMGDRWGGSITAALFLQKFVGEVPWMHLDIAGPSFADKNYGIYTKGGTGQGVLAFLALIDNYLAPPPSATEEAEA